MRMISRSVNGRNHIAAGDRPHSREAQRPGPYDAGTFDPVLDVLPPGNSGLEHLYQESLSARTTSGKSNAGEMAMFSADVIDDQKQTSFSELAKWVRDIAQLTKPDEVIWCDGSQDEWALVVGMHEALPNSISQGHSMSDSSHAEASGRRAYGDLLKLQQATKKNVYVLASHSHYFMDGIFNTAYWRANGGVLPEIGRAHV